MHSVTLFRTRKTLHSRPSHTTASLDLDRIDSETLRKPFRPAKITFISKSVIYAG